MAIYDRYTDEALARQLDSIAGNIRYVDKESRAEILIEAAKRLRQERNDELQKFKERIRDRMIKEADRRNWCSEFDAIINEYGMRGRYGNYIVKYRYKEYKATYTSRTAWEWREGESPVIASNDAHAVQLVGNSIRRSYGSEFEILSVEEKP